MAQYVDGYVLPVPKKNLKAYARVARQGRDTWMKCGALDYKECVGDDLWVKGMLPFPKAFKLKPGEVPVFSYIVFKSRAHRDQVNKRVMKEVANFDCSKGMPFDVKRMAYGGFKAIVEA